MNMNEGFYNFDVSPEWVSRHDENWRFVIRTFVDVHSGKPIIRYNSACEAKEHDSDSFILWCQFGGVFPKWKKIEYLDGYVHSSFSGTYRTVAYVDSVPYGVSLCQKCLGEKRWNIAAKKFGINFDYPKAIEKLEQFDDLSSFEPYNRYFLALRDIYKSTYELTYSSCTIKLLDRKKYMRGDANRIIREFLQLGIVVLNPTDQTTYVKYNTDVDIETTMEVLTWYGREKKSKG